MGHDITCRLNIQSNLLKCLIKSAILILFFCNKLRKFLRDYLDGTKKNVNHNQRNRELSDQIFNEAAAPPNCPAWTLKGYNGELKRHVDNACK